jgi:D-alanyl-D-alanine carboxypeptidase/D-alanyl-D-alanine-endopeptidase (penicillin-binding protein 4)
MRAPRATRILAGLAATLAALSTLAGHAHARPGGPPLGTRLGSELAAPGVAPSLTGAVARDLGDGEELLVRNATKPLRPASTQKLTVALAALAELGPAFRIKTVVLGRGEQEGASWRGDLVLKGYGDPSLHGDDLSLLAQRVRARGIRRVTGRVIGDESYFDARRTAPGWKPQYAVNECPPLSALVVDRAVLDGRSANEPALAAAVAFERALETAGIEVARKAAAGSAGLAAVELARVLSPPLARLVRWMNTESDNFVAEMLLKALGARELGRGTTRAGAAVVRRELAERRIPLLGVRIVDGSGLSREDRLTARALVALLVSARGDEEISRPFVASLAVAGATGTLEDRMRMGPARGRVRAKTGTTDVVSALAGYAGAGYAFAVLMNGDPIAVEAARAAQDGFAQVLARAL